MKDPKTITVVFMAFCLLSSCELVSKKDQTLLKFDFNKNLKSEGHEFSGHNYSFVKGIDGDALVLNSDRGYNSLKLDSLSLNGTKDFSVQCWIKTTSKKPTVFLSQKDFNNKSIGAQKNAGWVLYSSEGTFAWNIGSGKRRINYERGNGEKMPVNDGEWHQLTITYNKELAEFRLYYDGHNKAIYKVNFEFNNNEPLIIGATGNTFNYDKGYSLDIKSGLLNLQAYVNGFNDLGLEPIKNEEFIDLIVEPKNVFKNKLKTYKGSNIPNDDSLSKVLDLRKKLGANPYTVFQNRELTNLKPVSKVYALHEGKVIINELIGKSFTQNEKLFPSNFAIDNLSIWERTISEDEVLTSFNDYMESKPFKLTEKLNNFNVGVWNIWHGGIHWSLEKDGWDSRLRIVEMIKEKDLDVILMQETYSSGDYIAAELGYFYATTSDWDYCYQGENISVISRYPIKEIKVSEEAEFNNVAVKLAISKTQEIWAMSNWYGMGNFSKVYDFHKTILDNTDVVPVVFGGDFNAVPHTDNGDKRNLASIKFEGEGYTDAYRSLHPDVEKSPGFSHRGNVRIDQLYYKGKGLRNTSTEVVSSWSTGFPSDHYLIVSKFELNY